MQTGGNILQCTKINKDIVRVVVYIIVLYIMLNAMFNYNLVLSTVDGIYANDFIVKVTDIEALVDINVLNQNLKENMYISTYEEYKCILLVLSVIYCVVIIFTLLLNRMRKIVLLWIPFIVIVFISIIYINNYTAYIDSIIYDEEVIINNLQFHRSIRTNKNKNLEVLMFDEEEYTKYLKNVKYIRMADSMYIYNSEISNYEFYVYELKVKN